MRSKINILSLFISSMILGSTTVCLFSYSLGGHNHKCDENPYVQESEK